MPFICNDIQRKQLKRLAGIPYRFFLANTQEEKARIEKEAMKSLDCVDKCKIPTWVKIVVWNYGLDTLCYANHSLTEELIKRKIYLYEDDCTNNKEKSHIDVSMENTVKNLLVCNPKLTRQEIAKMANTSSETVRRWEKELSTFLKKWLTEELDN